MILGFCLFATSFVLDLEGNLRRFSEGINLAKNRLSTARQYVELRKALAEFIDFHAEARE